ncbi:MULTISPECIES: oligopeptide ABC transporter permease OppB [unclassified Acinetobacter]|uniref:oligopeptide ABC transporter permease OppB n=1 Tax=unclassified Acinetobacter TaxID=196816 RepID=UPI0035BAB7AA
MFKLIIKRLLEAIPTIFVLITVSFFIMRLAPGSPFSGDRNLPPEVIASLEAKYGFDAPLWKQFLNYLVNLLHGDFGPSFKYKDKTVNELLAQSFWPSFEIGLYAFIIAVTIGITLGVVAALNQNTVVDYTTMGIGMLGGIVPSFVIAPIAVFVVAVKFQLLPAGGWNDGALRNLILPVSVLAFLYIAEIARLTRSSMIETMNSPFIRTARAKGLPTSHIIFKHALRPALLPVINHLGPTFVGIITGSIVIETVFGLPGLGQLFVNGALNRDYGLVLSLTIVVGVLTVIFNAVADILMSIIDPKIRFD